MLTRCYCCGPCSVISDTLATNNLGLYTQVAGTWTHSSGFYQTSSNDAILIHTVEPAPETKKLRAIYEVRFNDYGDETHIYFGWLDASNHIVGRLTFTETCRLFELFEVAAGVETKIGEIDAATLKKTTGSAVLRFIVHWDGNVLGASITPIGFGFDVDLVAVNYDFPYTTEPPGTRVGVGTGTISGAFKLLYLEVTRWRSDCLLTDRPTCFRQVDYFTRPNAATPGCRWDVRAGTWTIDANTLKPTTTGAVIHDYDYPSQSHKISAIPRVVGGDGIARMIVAWTDDDNYLFAKVGPAITRLYKRVGGVESPISLRGAGPPDNSRVSVSYNGTRAAVLWGSGPALSGYAPGFTGTRVGFGAEDLAGVITFDEFFCYSPLAVSGTETVNNCAIAPLGECATTYCNTFAPPRLTVTIPGAVNGTCGTCATLAQTLLLDGGENALNGFGVNHGFVGNCQWGFSAAIDFCGYTKLQCYVGFAKFGGTPYLTGLILLQNVVTFAKWLHYFKAATAAPYDCLSWNGITLDPTKTVPDDWAGLFSQAPYYCKNTGAGDYTAGPMEVWAEL